MKNEKSRQEEAWEYISSNFVKLIQGDKQLPYETKRSIEAFWLDLFAEPGVRNNILQAVNNFLWEIDGKMESARKAGIMMALSTLERQFPTNEPTDDGYHVVTLPFIQKQLTDLLKAEEVKETALENVESTDLSEVGGGDEDDTPLL